jgi:hypothetical protein
MPGIEPQLQPLENVIRERFLPALFRREVSALEREIFSLPARMGGMGIFNPTEESTLAFSNSMLVSGPLVRLLLRQESDLDPGELSEEVKILRAQIDCTLEDIHKAKFNKLNTSAPREMQNLLRHARAKGASSWVTAAPSIDHGTVLSKREFIDAVSIRYGWEIQDLPLTCICGSGFSVQHAIDCSWGGFRGLQHNEVRDLLAKVMNATLGCRRNLNCSR